MSQPVQALKGPRTKDCLLSYTLLELLIARDPGCVDTIFIKGDALPTAFAPEPPEPPHPQQALITEFANDGRNIYRTFSQWDQPAADTARGLKQAIEAIKFEISVLAGKPACCSKVVMITAPTYKDYFTWLLIPHQPFRREERGSLSWLLLPSHQECALSQLPSTGGQMYPAALHALCQPRRSPLLAKSDAVIECCCLEQSFAIVYVLSNHSAIPL